MRANVVLKVAAILVFTFFITSIAGATSVTKVRGGSNYGPESTFASCADGSVLDCEAFGPVSTVSFGGVDFTVSQFVFNTEDTTVSCGGHAPPCVLNLVDLGVLTANQTFTLPPTLFNPALTEIFACGNGSDGATSAVDSLGSSISTFCTQGLTGALPDLDQNGTSFTTGAGYNFGGHLVLDAPAGGAVGTPEPATIALLGIGLAALGGKSLRERMARRAV
jgi:hypothetical protein